MSRRGARCGCSQPLARETIRVLHQLHIDGWMWTVMAVDCDIHMRTLQMALLKKPVTYRVRRNIETFAERHGKRVRAA